MISKEELEQMYWDEEMSQLEIAKNIGVSCTTVHIRMKRYEIKIRTPSEAQLTLKGVQKPSKEELHSMYWDQEMSQSEIARKIGVGYATVSNWMAEHGIKARTKSESLVDKCIGENNGNWQGGLSGGKYCYKFNNKFKEDVRERDDYTCQLCGCEQLLGGRALDVHHIHYDRENCYPDVVALCRSCNISVNGDRDYWEDYFETHLIVRGLLNWSMN